MDVSDFQPIQNYVLIDQDEDPDQTDEGLYVPGEAKNTCVTGTVLSAGPGYKGRSRNMQLEEGDRVLFHGGSSRDFPGAGETLRMVRQTNIFATIDDVAVGAYQTA
jgi:co-chaperonin GroES (HSP10)